MPALGIAHAPADNDAEPPFTLARLIDAGLGNEFDPVRHAFELDCG